MGCAAPPSSISATCFEPAGASYGSWRSSRSPARRTPLSGFGHSSIRRARTTGSSTAWLASPISGGTTTTPPPDCRRGWFLRSLSWTPRIPVLYPSFSAHQWPLSMCAPTVSWRCATISGQSEREILFVSEFFFRTCLGPGLFVRDDSPSDKESRGDLIRFIGCNPLNRQPQGKAEPAARAKPNSEQPAASPEAKYEVALANVRAKLNAETRPARTQKLLRERKHLCQELNAAKKVEQ